MKICDNENVGFTVTNDSNSTLIIYKVSNNKKRKQSMFYIAYNFLLLQVKQLYNSSSTSVRMIIDS